MNRWRFLLAGVILLALSGCAVQPQTSTPATSVKLANLPCAETSRETNAMTISYPAETLYQNGAVLPKQTGLACLEALAGGLSSVPLSRWQATVSAEEGYGFDPLQLAGKRQELLQRFFARKGIETKDWQWQTEIGQGQQLQLLELKETP